MSLFVLPAMAQDEEYDETDNADSEEYATGEESSEQIAAQALAQIVGFGDYYVTNWDYKAQVHSDNTWEVTETITVQFDQAHHGIFRWIPRVFEYGGNMYFTKIKDIHVPDYDWDDEDVDGNAKPLNIIIGDEYKTLTGPHTYVIKYKLCYPADKIDSEDFVYSCVLGDGWPTTIKKFTFEVLFDKALPQSAIDNAKVYSGAYGSNGDALNVGENCWINEKGYGGEIEMLPPKNAISVLFGLPNGFFSDVQEESGTLQYILFAIALLIGGFLLMKLLTTVIEKPVRTVEFYPPEGMSSAEVGTIIDETPDPEDLASLIPWFADKGYLKIKEIEKPGLLFGKKKDLQLTRVKDLPADAPDYQKTFFDEVLFRSGTTLDLSALGDCHIKIQSATRQIKSLFTGKRELSETSLWGLLFIPQALVLGLAILTNTVFGITSVEGLSSSICTAILLCVAAFARINYSQKRSYGNSKDNIKSIIFVILCALGAWGLYMVFADDYSEIVSREIVSVFILASFVPMFFIDRMSKDTSYRIDVTGKILGLKEFIKTAEQDRLKMLVDENPEYFYNILPYAMVFGLTDKWAKQFRNIDMEEPSWYDSDTSVGLLSGAALASTLGSSFSKSISDTIRASSHDPSSSSSSSSSGGGYSGGGGGGGGGGAW